jgi:lipopolysaccharide transport system permease protein
MTDLLNGNPLPESAEAASGDGARRAGRRAGLNRPPLDDSTDQIPFLKLRATSKWSAINFAELWQFRDLLFTLSNRDLKLRYKQTALGVIWVVLQPLLAAGVFSFVFGKVAKMPSDGMPYFLFSYAGLLGWNLFNNTLTKASGCLLGNSHLISKVFFPRLVLPLSTVPSTLVDFAVAAAMMAVLMLIYHVSPTPALLLLPVWMALLTLLSLGIGLITAALAVSYRDVNYILPVITQLWMYASPIAYAASAVPARFRTYYELNPLAPILEAFRWSLLKRGDMQLMPLAWATVSSGVIFVIGLYGFKRMERKFADVI